jgi:hypothetical protein
MMPHTVMANKTKFTILFRKSKSLEVLPSIGAKTILSNSKKRSESKGT